MQIKTIIRYYFSHTAKTLNNCTVGWGGSGETPSCRLLEGMQTCPTLLEGNVAITSKTTGALMSFSSHLLGSTLRILVKQYEDTHPWGYLLRMICHCKMLEPVQMPTQGGLNKQGVSTRCSCTHEWRRFLWTEAEWLLGHTDTCKDCTHEYICSMAHSGKKDGDRRKDTDTCSLVQRNTG